MKNSSILNNCNIKTPRFFLRNLRPEDASEHYLRWMNCDIARKYIVASKQRQTISSLRHFITEKDNQDNCLFLGIFLLQNNKHIGNIKYEPINFDLSQAFMGVLIGDNNWRGKAVFQEVLLYSSIWLKKHFGIKEILLGVEKSNISAIKAYTKAGFEVADTKNDNKTGRDAIEMSLVIKPNISNMR
tara:strand:- start:38 stop:595 length:558 start_codon:yes stop_codon:yes gene_type:complete